MSFGHGTPTFSSYLPDVQEETVKTVAVSRRTCGRLANLRNGQSQLDSGRAGGRNLNPEDGIVDRLT